MCSRLQSCPVKHSDVLKGTVSQNQNIILNCLFTLRSLSRSLAALEVLAQRSFISVSFCTLKVKRTPCKSLGERVSSFDARPAEKYFENKNLF